MHPEGPRQLDTAKLWLSWQQVGSVCVIWGSLTSRYFFSDRILSFRVLRYKLQIALSFDSFILFDDFFVTFRALQQTNDDYSLLVQREPIKMLKYFILVDETARRPYSI